jgi:hypothetical protein
MKQEETRRRKLNPDGVTSKSTTYEETLVSGFLIVI